MSSFARTPKSLLRLIHYPPRVVYALGLGPLMGRLILLLTTTGRKSGMPRVTPLQYEEVDGAIYLGAARGRQADWVRNIAANSNVTIRVGRRQFRGIAEIVSDIPRIADFLEMRLQRHPKMVGAMLKAEGLSNPPSRAQLEAHAAGLTLVMVHEETDGDRTVHKAGMNMGSGQD
ncbi:MAG: nitroreductase family deazaflavin-dependent oxidoreductase [Anaerolineae bacterium]|nr:nitroreductase family deazaflavin-dependent oxidoreductase [Anaerolineae bacterium]